MPQPRFQVGQGTGWSAPDAVRALIERLSELFPKFAQFGLSLQHLTNVSHRLEGMLGRLNAVMVGLVGLPRLFNSSLHHSVIMGAGGGHGRGGSGEGGYHGEGSRDWVSDAKSGQDELYEHWVEIQRKKEAFLDQQEAKRSGHATATADLAGFKGKVPSEEIESKKAEIAANLEMAKVYAKKDPNHPKARYHRKEAARITESLKILEANSPTETPSVHRMIAKWTSATTHPVPPHYSVPPLPPVAGVLPVAGIPGRAPSMPYGVPAPGVAGIPPTAGVTASQAQAHSLYQALAQDTAGQRNWFRRLIGNTGNMARTGPSGPYGPPPGGILGWLFNRFPEEGGRERTSRAGRFANASPLAFLGLGAMAHGLVNAASPDVSATLHLSLQLLAGEIGEHLIPMFMKLAFNAQRLSDFLSEHKGIGGFAAGLLKWGVIITGATTALKLFNSVLFGLPLKAASSGLELLSKVSFMSARNMITFGIGLLAAIRLISTGMGHLTEIGEKRQKVEDVQKSFVPDAAAVIAASGFGLNETEAQKRERLKALQKEYDIVHSSEIGKLAEANERRGVLTPQEQIGLAAGFKSPRMKEADRLEEEAYDLAKRRKGLAEAIATVRTGQLPEHAADFRANAAQGLLMSIRSLRVQPQYSSIEDAYKNIQVSALSKDPLEQKLERVMGQRLMKMIEQQAEMLDLTKEEVNHLRAMNQ